MLHAGRVEAPGHDIATTQLQYKTSSKFKSPAPSWSGSGRQQHVVASGGRGCAGGVSSDGGAAAPVCGSYVSRMLLPLLISASAESAAAAPLRVK